MRKSITQDMAYQQFLMKYGVGRTSRKYNKTLFAKNATELDIQHKLIRPHTLKHNGKVKHSHLEDQKRLYSDHSFFSLPDLENSSLFIITVPIQQLSDVSALLVFSS